MSIPLPAPGQGTGGAVRAGRAKVVASDDGPPNPLLTASGPGGQQIEVVTRTSR
jgi:hypothetical protein